MIIKTYVFCVKNFLEFFGKEKNKLDEDLVKNYLQELLGCGVIKIT